MSNKTGNPATIIKFSVPSTPSLGAWINNGNPIGSLSPGLYNVVMNTAIGPVTVGSNIQGTTAICSGVAAFGSVGSVSLVQLQQSATTGANLISRHSSSNVVNINVTTPLYIYVAATVSAGNFISSNSVQDSLCNNITFIKIQ
jgi:hypothetical protein